jgi:hypothetical protein
MPPVGFPASAKTAFVSLSSTRMNQHTSAGCMFLERERLAVFATNGNNKRLGESLPGL